jgi:hypothetical protein
MATRPDVQSEAFPIIFKPSNLISGIETELVQNSSITGEDMSLHTELIHPILLLASMISFS